MKCIHCNSEVADGMKFCPYCGSPMNFQQQPQQGQYQQPQQGQYQQPQQGQYQQPQQGQYQQPQQGQYQQSYQGQYQQPQQGHYQQQGQYQQPYQGQYRQQQGQYQQPYQGQYQQSFRQQQPQRPQNPRLNFVEAINIASNRLTETDGRSRRSEFWWWYLAIGIVAVIISIIPYVGAFSQLISLALLYAITIRRLNDVPAPKWVGKVYIGCWLVCCIIMLIYSLGVIYDVAFFEGFIYGFGRSNFTNLMGIVYIVEVVVGVIGLYYFIKDSNPDIDPMYGPSPKYTL